MSHYLIDLVGYLGSVFVIISFLMKDIDILRIVSIVACCIFVVYGYLTGTMPTIILNSIIILLNFYKLYWSKTSKQG
jgi:uncharacterized protein with PQ loop repeat